MILQSYLIVPTSFNSPFRCCPLQSLEVILVKEDFEQLMSYVDIDTLVVGPVLEGHEFSSGENLLRGRTCPWNTAAIWNVKAISLVGFPLIGDGSLDMEGGVEVRGPLL